MIPAVLMNMGFAAGEAATIVVAPVVAIRQSYAAIHMRTHRFWWLALVLEEWIRGR